MEDQLQNNVASSEAVEDVYVRVRIHVPICTVIIISFVLLI